MDQAIASLGPMHAASWETDPKHLAFVLARYHFVARLLTGRGHVLEVGCGEGTGAWVVAQTVGSVTGIDIDQNLLPRQAGFAYHNIVDSPFLRRDAEGEESPWDAIYALDVLEHIPRTQENKFFEHIGMCLSQWGCLIIGTPSAESQRYASSESKQYHVNCKSEDELRKTCQKFYDNVFIFGMNDTTLHTGYGPMCHYRFAVCC